MGVIQAFGAGLYRLAEAAAAILGIIALAVAAAAIAVIRTIHHDKEEP